MPVKPSCSIHPLLAVPRNHWKETDAGGGYRAHLRVVTENSFSLVVGRSNPRNRRLGRAWGTTGVTLFSHSQTHPHAEALQFRMHGSTEMCLLRVPLIRRVGGKRVQTPRRGLVPRHRRQIFSPPNNSGSIPQIQCGISDGATVHRTPC
ncbi:RNA-binding protein [Trypanosoma cruzi]|nr:RNA-binding protein [Trypanosoma cruzi]